MTSGKAQGARVSHSACGSGPSAQGRRIAVARRVTMALVLVAVLASLAFDLGLGTPSSFGVGEFFLLCPLGGVEAMIASGSFLPASFISLLVIVAFTLVFGRAWCAWGCPAPAIRRFFRREPKAAKPVEAHAEAVAVAGSTVDIASEAKAGEDARRGKTPSVAGGCSAAQEVRGLAASLRHIGRDPRTWALVCVLAATCVAGLPLFCLVCPIGLTFGTVGSLWHLFVDKQVTLSCVVFPLALVVELVVYRRWCLNLCPVAGLLNVFGQFARLFRPRVNASTCLKCTGHSACAACAKACPEHIDLHAANAAIQLGECTRCGECVRQCPTASVCIGVAPGKALERK